MTWWEIALLAALALAGARPAATFVAAWIRHERELARRVSRRADERTPW